MAGYTRQSTFADGDTITAALFNNEYNQLLNAFNSLTGHKHDGTTGEGAVIALIGDTGVATPLNKVLIDTTNDHIEFWVDVSSTSVQQLYIADGAIIPVTDNDIDLGTSSLEFKNIYIDGTATIDTLTIDEAATIGTTLGVTGATTLSSTLAVTGTSTLTGNVTATNDLSVGGNLTVTGNATISGNLTFGDADTDSINLAAEIDSDIIPNTDGTYDLGSATKEWQDLYIDGTANIDSLVADTADINGGTIDGATIATSDITVGAGKTLDVSSGTLTLADNQISGDKVEGGTIAATTITTLTSTTGNITNVNATTLDTTNIEVTNLKAKDGTSAGSIANTTGVVTLGSSVLTTTDINGGTIDGVTIGGTTAGAVTFTDLSDGTITIAGFADEDNMVSNSATLLPTQQSVKAYVDSQVTAQDLDFQGDTGGALSIDLDSESLTIAGGTGLDTVGSGNTVTVNIDSTIATLTGTQTLTNKTLTSPDINTPDIDGGTIDSTVIGGATPAAGTFTTLTANTSITGTLTGNVTGNLTGNVTGNVTGDVTGDLTGTVLTAAQPNITSLGTLTGLTTSGDINFGDDDKAVFGAGSDLQIYHSGTASFITENGTGDLRLSANNLLLRSDDAYVQSEDGTVNSARFNSTTGVTLYRADAQKLATTSSGIDVTGTVTADGLFISDGNATIEDIASASVPTLILNDRDTAISPSQSQGRISFQSSDNSPIASGERTFINSSINSAGSTFQIDIGAMNSSGTLASRLNILGTGDISFYDDTGTSQALFWDASAESLGIGTTSPSSDLHIYENANTDTTLKIQNPYSGGGSAYASTQLITNAGTAILGLNSSSRSFLAGTQGFYISSPAQMVFAPNATEAMRIDTSGNLLVGTTNLTWLSVAGHRTFNNGSTTATVTNSTVGSFNRLSTDGEILNFRKDGSTVGSIGNTASDLYIGTGDVGISFYDYSTENAILPHNPDTNSAADASIDLGRGTSGSQRRFKDLYLSGTGYFGTSVGIGTTSPKGLFSVYTNAGAAAFTSEGISTAAAAGEDVSSIDFINRRSNANTIKANIKHITDGTANGSALTFGTTTGSGATERMRIDSSGNVGIGTTSPNNQSRLTLNLPSGTNGRILTMGRSAGAYAYHLGVDASSRFTLYNNDGTSSLMAVDSSGNVGIGTTSPNTPAGNKSLHIAGTTGAELILERDDTGVVADDFIGGLAFLNSDSSNTPPHYLGITARAFNEFGATQLEFFSSFEQYPSGTPDMVLDPSGNLGIGNSSPQTNLDILGDDVNDGSPTIRLTNSLSLGDWTSITGDMGRFEFFTEDTSGEAPYVTGRITCNNDATSGTRTLPSGALKFWTRPYNTSSLTNAMTLSSGGSLSKLSGSFKIDHPLESKTDTHYLVHSFVEAPQADNIYRGVVTLVDGSATINLDTEAGMTEGTFVLLNTNTSCFTSNESDWDAVKGNVSGNTLTISCQNTSSTATVSWLVIGERHDQHMIDTDWTDENGKVIVEPLKG